MKLSYAEKLRDPRWQKRRLEVMERDNWTCMDCFSREKTLNAHHVIYYPGRDPWDYPDNLLMTLCEPCHGQREDEQRRLIVALKDCNVAQVSLLASSISDATKLGVRSEFLHAVWVLSGIVGRSGRMEREVSDGN